MRWFILLVVLLGGGYIAHRYGLDTEVHRFLFGQLSLTQQMVALGVGLGLLALIMFPRR